VLQQAEKAKDQAASKLRAFWPDAPATASAPAPVAKPLPIFQAVPAPPTLVGRDAELAQLTSAILAGQRLCVLRGMPGVGKTALAAQAVYELRDHFPDGVLWAQLDKSETKDILHTFASAYGRDVSEYQDIGTRSAVVREIFAHKRALIVLDSTFNTDDIRALLPPSTSPSAVIITTTNRRVLPFLARLSATSAPRRNVPRWCKLCNLWVGYHWRCA
jgi:NB-ARC domain